MISKRNLMLLQIVLKYAKNERKVKILDAGCGNGALAEALLGESENGRIEIIGEDISLQLCEYANKKGIKCLRVDLNKDYQPFPDNYFDIVILARVLEHLINPDFCLKEIFRILKPSGYLILSTPNLTCWFNRILFLLGIQPIFTEVSSSKIIGRRFKFLGQGASTVGHIRVFSFQALKDIILMNGFKIIQICGAPFLENNALDKIFSIIPSLSSYLILIAQKPAKLP